MSQSMTCGLILTGLTGSGKSTLQNGLLQNGCWTPRLATSRPVDASESEIIEHIPYDDFVPRVRKGELVVPVIFGGNLYAWTQLDLEKLRVQPIGAALNTRPYTALLLAAMIPKLIPVWLDLAEDERHKRLADRRNVRDRDSALAALRLAMDAEDLSYRELFSYRILSDVNALDNLIGILEGRFLPA